MQPIVKDRDGHARFRANEIVRTLLDESRKRGFSLNDLATRDFVQTDWEQFYQLLGYSLIGYHELSSVSDASCVEATKAAREVMPEAYGCRDNGCSIHSGVEQETVSAYIPQSK